MEQFNTKFTREKKISSKSKAKVNCKSKDLSLIYEGFVNILFPQININVEQIDGISFCIPTNGMRSDKTELTIKSIKS